ncbi:MAG: non-canonical purine NTP pyrophosphatase, RdgB/HAM1 family [Candidatus Raymondbacteria bacterium RifOxyA12_full_50_37]|uniref:dITP/XTP pyrophosphatase n=1 Tax=Candidatus Raymondbacteria bacterium RIFOXYD12_FULL_49_13 TaxID=1817890 RepID=A0A1F7F1G4_UNCRA|nr:MAG: non-canonical purine NTP pyrophosphatase, RdgB/HAM1 family [Candidatus Raymondbacteria bacterium RifOxyA12_full_50_37]OGJ93865.1 MAG: non-canonical purine NTP pyrophosphatase, RdgB/HAM1 family [Candidatus Raymondbacteria bacterium RIFOXYA2_FULL_49_16]OGJ98266.1 MAG: non-canonical purine NTP pyrophosphatase, RdgB/HAM1 family [Candidatus Raymondbacteria bacterium RIFOXYC2_FULL_50_21]OGJ98430.1 MAG: non-canonical purine NTP pyrophosphatase, RdgB/HAM1 family [Candidatus Raymondbacteria bacte
MYKNTIIIATRNNNKVTEIKEIYSKLPYEFTSIEAFPGMPEIVEDADTFEGNALKKALAVLNFIREFPVLADDSGLEVDALNGAPGVFSSRFSGGSSRNNNLMLLEKMKSVLWEMRTARFRCAAVFIVPGRKPTISHGTIEGRIGFEERGEGGFGYDPLFIPIDSEKTLAQMSSLEKNRQSHRFKAFTKLRSAIFAEGA